MTDKYHSDTQEKIETLAYLPGLQNTGDKEAGTHTIVPIARPAIASAQYSHSLTLLKPSDARLAVKRIAARLNVNIAGLGTATHVYCSVRVDVDDTDHELFNEDWTSIGDKLDAVDTYDTNKAAIFNLLKDGAAHTFYFLFWADIASQATIDLVQLWEGIGSSGTSGRHNIFELFHNGRFWAAIQVLKMDGSGASWRLCPEGGGFSLASYPIVEMGNYTKSCQSPFLSVGKIFIEVDDSDATDMATLRTFYSILRSEQ